MASTKPLKVLAVGLDWFPEHGGGLDRYFLDVVRHAGDANIEMRGLVAGRATVATESDDKVAAFSPRDRSLAHRALAARAAIGKRLRTWRPDLVAAHFAWHAWPVLGRINVPFVVHFQGPWAMESGIEGRSSFANRIKHRIERRVYRRADRCIVLSQAFGDLLAARYDVDPARIRVVPASIDVDRFAALGVSRTDARAAFGWPTDRPIVLCVRRLVARMGLRQLIEAVASVKRDHPTVLCLIVGRGPDADALARLIAELGVEDNVRLTGFVADDDLPRAYRAADLSIVPTQELEGFGLITAESLAAGTPVLATPVGGLPEAIQGLSHSLVLTDASTSAIAAGLRGWLEGTLPLPDATTCRDYAIAHFSWPIGMRRIRAVYDEAVEAHR